MKKILAFLFLAGITNLVSGQSGKLAGLVLDSLSSIPLSSATISVFENDSSILSYQLSDADGRFLFQNLPARQKLKVNVTFVGYYGIDKYIELKDNTTDSITLRLSLNLNYDDTIVVASAIPIRMNGDTLEINPAAFKMDANTVVEELLNQVPGITIWSDGSITVNGKKVQNLYVEGKKFMDASDPRVATQSLPKDAIEKIQLYQEYDRKQIGKQQTPQDSILSMNIQLKETAKKGYFGKLSAGYGTDNRYEGDLTFQTYNKRSSLGIGGGYNNINKNIDNLQDIFQNNTYRQWNPNLNNVGKFNSSGINRNHSFGGVLVHDFIETSNSRQNDRLTLNYNNSGNNSYVSHSTFQSLTVVDNPQFTNSTSTNNNQNSQHQFGLRYVKTNSYYDNFNINGNGSVNNGNSQSENFTEVYDVANHLLSTNKVTNVQSSKRGSSAFGIEYASNDSENPLKNFNLQANANLNDYQSNRMTQSAFDSYINNAEDTTYNRKYFSQNNSTHITATLNYNGFKRLLLGRFDLYGIELIFSQWVNFTKDANHSEVSDLNVSTSHYYLNDRLSFREKRSVFEYSPILEVRKSFFKWNDKANDNISMSGKLIEDLKSEQHTSTILNRNLSRRFDFLRYEGSVNYNHTRNERYTYFLMAFYKKNFEYPNINQLYTIVDDINVYSTRYGNPDLKNRINHNFTLNGSYRTIRPQSVYNFDAFLNAGYLRSLSPVSDSIINNASGMREYYYVNVTNSNSFNYNYNLNISRKLNKNQIQLMYNGYANFTKMPNYVDGEYSTGLNKSVSHDFKLQFSLRSALILTAGQTIQSYKNIQTGKGLNNSESRNLITKFGSTWNATRDLSFSSTLDIVYNSNLNDDSYLWNAFGSYRFMKQQALVKFSAMDILKQYQNITSSVNMNGSSTTITNGLQQFFILTFSYFPRKFGKTEIKKQSTEVKW